MLTLSDLDAAEIEAEATIMEWEQEFQQEFYAEGTQAARVKQYLSNPKAAPTEREQRQAKRVRDAITKQQGG